jgi:hypothetical protein
LLIQHVIDNQNIEDGIRRRLEDERTSWETKYNDARSRVAILERQLEVALGHVAILERQPEEDRDNGTPGVRDSEHPCADYDPAPGGPGCCDGDGHYLCWGCKQHSVPPRKESQE